VHARPRHRFGGHAVHLARDPPLPPGVAAGPGRQAVAVRRHRAATGRRASTSWRAGGISVSPGGHGVSSWGYVVAGWLVTAVVIVLYAAWIVVRGCSLSREVPLEERRWL